ncbi:hypothetical protein FQS60_00245 [Escherichia coli]|nr:hypothetical protein [Escherichia coli]MDN1407102.1 hypothetical protein [Escherichia coli]SRZ07738.1 Uncharacterised protein [Escherichia coli]HAJ6230581.1 hypothetical protein [Escherichia coli]
MCIEMCIELILELAGFALLLALCDVVLFPSPAPIYLHIIYLPFLLYLIFYIILIQALQTFRNRRNTSPFFCKQKAFTQCNRHVS